MKDSQEARTRMLMNAALDGELDAAGMIEVERTLAQDPTLEAEYARLRALRSALRAPAMRHAAPKNLRDRMAALAASGEVRGAEPASAPRARPTWSLLAAGLAFGLLLGLLATSLVRQPASDPRFAVASALVDAHRRSLLATTPVDVVSSDKHTIKPWLDQHLAISPRVADPPPAGTS